LPNSDFFKPSVDVFSIHGLFTRLPRRLMPWLYQELPKKIFMPKLMIGCQGHGGQVVSQFELVNSTKSQIDYRRLSTPASIADVTPRYCEFSQNYNEQSVKKFQLSNFQLFC
jgi:hypothetical protein